MPRVTDSKTWFQSNFNKKALDIASGSFKDDWEVTASVGCFFRRRVEHLYARRDSARISKAEVRLATGVDAGLQELLGADPDLAAQFDILEARWRPPGTVD